MQRERIKRIVRESGHTYQSLAEEIGVSPQAISEIVSGRTRGNTARYAVAVALGVTVEDLWPGTAPTPADDAVPERRGSPLDSPARGRQDGLRASRRVAAVQQTGLLGAAPPEELSRLARIAQRALHGSHALLVLVDGSRRHIVGSSDSAAPAARSYPLARGPIGDVVATGELVAIGNVAADARYPTDPLLEELDAAALAAAPLSDPEGNVLGVLMVTDTCGRSWAASCGGMLQDLAGSAAQVIELRRLAEGAEQSTGRLADLSERLRQITAHSEQVYWISHLYSGRAEYVSPAFDKIYGVDGRVVTEEGGFLELIHPDDRERVAASLPQQVLGPYEHEYRIVRPGGEVRWIRSRAVPVRDEHGETYRVTGIARDITEEKRMQSFLRRALEGLYLSAPEPREAFCRVDDAGLHFRPGEKMERAFGPFPAPGEGWTWWEAHVHPEDREPVLESIREALRSRSGLWEAEYRLRARNRSYHRVRGTAFVLHEADSEVIAVIRDLGPIDPDSSPD
jgi:PAS domain S-box-containing protein